MTNMIVTVQGSVEKIIAAGSRSHKGYSCFKQGVNLLRIKTLSGA
jgi:hypothetical protein